MKTIHFLPVLRALAVLAIATAASHAMSQPGAATDPRGRWITANGNLEVEITPCGNALCGTVTKVLGNRSMSRDGAAMDPVDTRPALGMKLLHDFVPRVHDKVNEPPTEWNGEIYNRENGKTYSCQMSVNTATNATGELVLHAYIGVPLFGKTQRWQRAPLASTGATTEH
jgi:uncharacterized protein (DUF2147 family)